MSISTVSQSQLGQDTAKNSQVVTTVIKNFNSGTLGSGPSITSVVVTDSSYNNLDDTAVTTSNGYIKIIGTGFTSTANVYIGSSAVPAANVTFVSSTEIRARVPVLSVGNYSLSLFNSNSSGTISSSTFIVSSAPVWVTSSSLSNQLSGAAFEINFSATTDSSVTYSNTTALPAGTTLAANGYFSGTVTIGTETNYSFDVKATDTENQDASRTFSLTVTVLVPKIMFSAGISGTNGLNNFGTKTSSLSQVGSNTDWASVIGGSGAVFALKNNNTLWGWGQNNEGRLGQNNTSYRSSPTQIAGTNWATVGGNLGTTLAIKTDNTLWSWGENSSGQLGLNNTPNRSSPVQVGADTNWAAVFDGQGFSNSIQMSMATKTDGTLWTWGANGNGQLGLNDRVNRSSPVQVGTATNWPTTQSKLTGTSTGVWAIKSNGTLWHWGNGNNIVPLGTPNVYYRSSPTQIGDGTTWLQISGGWYSLAAIKNDGTLWTWGASFSGIHGTNNDINKSSPVQVGTLTNWSTVRLGMQNAVAVRTDGILLTWGNNYHGQLGHGDKIYRSSPTQIGSASSWKTEYGSVSAGAATFALSAP
jgi:alpha-tubulin suppressor-like RCC1 family protein